MPIRFTVQGVNFEVDSPEEAVEIVRKLNKKRERILLETPNNGGQVTVGPPPQPKGIPEFWKNLDDNARKMLKALSDSPQGVETDDLSKNTGIAVENLKYELRKIQAKAKKFSLREKALISSKRISVEGIPKSRYSMKDRYRKEIQGLNP